MKTPAPRLETQKVYRIILENISDASEDARQIAMDALRTAYALPLETDQLIDALSEAIEALKTARNLADALKHPAHQDER